MATKSLTVLFIVTLFVFSYATKARYDFYKVVEVGITTREQFNVVKDLKSVGYISLGDAPGLESSSRIIVPPHKFAEFDEISKRFNLKTRTLTENLQAEIDREAVSQAAARQGDSSKYAWNRYMTTDEIYDWFDELVETYPGVVTVLELGTTYEQRPLKGVKISWASSTKKRAIFVEANIHAREWITGATATWLINALLTSTNPDVQDLAKNVDWYFVPIANPDGYEYSRTTDRMWRKTRSPHGSLCRGVDGNRNWDFYFAGVGTSQDPCTDIYPGPEAFSEPEFKAIADFFKTVASDVDAYISFHSYYQLLMYPYGIVAQGRASNEDEIKQVGEAMIKKIPERHGTIYKLGDIATIIYEAAGASLDWVKAEYDIPFPFEYELRDRGQYGFLLPPELIVPNSEEVLDSLIVMVKEARKLGYFEVTTAPPATTGEPEASTEEPQ